MTRRVVGAALLLTLGGCASATELVNALAKDNASACVSMKTALYGHLLACRTNTPGTAVLTVTPDGMDVKHQGGR